MKHFRLLELADELAYTLVYRDQNFDPTYPYVRARLSRAYRDNGGTGEFSGAIAHDAFDVFNERHHFYFSCFEAGIDLPFPSRLSSPST